MKFCPHCGGDLSQFNMHGATTSPSSIGTVYNQTSIWRAITERARAVDATPPSADVLVLPWVARMTAAATARPDASRGSPLKTVIHLAFDRDVVPRGGALHQITMTEGRSPMDLSRLQAMGYAVRDGKVQVVDDVPVGPAYQLLSYWGGDRQHKRWHLAAPCEINPSRNGDPAFMDANMIGFVATWKDMDKLAEALLELLELFTLGFGEYRHTIAIPLVLEMVAFPS